MLTKGLGTGVISTAIKQAAKPEQSWIDAAVKSMTTLNATAAEVAASGKFAVHAATDMTGFGLIGHAREMAAGSGVSLRIDSAKVPLLRRRARLRPRRLHSRRSQEQPRLRRMPGQL